MPIVVVESRYHGRQRDAAQRQLLVELCIAATRCPQVAEYTASLNYSGGSPAASEESPGTSFGAMVEFEPARADAHRRRRAGCDPASMDGSKIRHAVTYPLLAVIVFVSEDVEHERVGGLGPKPCLVSLGVDGDTWICRRDPKITMPWSAVADTSADGTPYLIPEIVLLFKVKHARPKDLADLTTVLPSLNAAQRAWLQASIEQVHPRHDWLRRI